MLKDYPVTYLGATVGKIEITKEGLYYRYKGEFQLTEDHFYRVYALAPSGKINLGVCNPTGGIWAISGTIAIRKLNVDCLQFEICTPEKIDTFIPINENQPISSLEHLMDYRFCRKGDLCGFINTSEPTQH